MRAPRFVAIAVIGLLPLTALAQDSEEKGLEIAIATDKADAGWDDSEAGMIMTLRNRQGNESVRHFRTLSLEVEGDGDKSISIFDRPADIKGTAVLTHTHKTGPDDQWLYLPALKRVKRISSANKTGSFVGSEFSYEDLSSQEVEKYTYNWLRDETCPNEPPAECWVIERFPVDENSGYSRQVVWIDQDEHRIRKVDYYARKEALLKTLTLADFREYLDDYWRAHRLSMVNHQTGKSTDLDIESMEFRTGLRDRDFDESTLERIR